MKIIEYLRKHKKQGKGRYIGFRLTDEQKCKHSESMKSYWVNKKLSESPY